MNGRSRLRTAALVVLAACVARDAQAVEGGAEDRVTTHAIAVATGGPSSPAFRCSGTLVSDRVVLTVRHCLSPLDEAATCSATFAEPHGAPHDFWIGATPWVLPSTSWKNVASWVLPTATSLCGNDVALLVLAEPFAAAEATPATPVVTRDAFERAAAARTLGIAGFGATTASGTDSGVRRSRFDIPLRCILSDGPGDACPPATYADATEFTSGEGPCVGDSGAGAIVPADRGLVFGVLSRATLAGSCGDGVYERTDVWAWLIARTVIDAAPAGAAPDWARALFPAAAREGDMCRDDASCTDGTRCLSLDGQRSYVCARSCADDGACSADRHCESSVCVPGRPLEPAGGCALGRPRAHGAAGLACLLAAALAFRRRRDRYG